MNNSAYDLATKLSKVIKFGLVHSITIYMSSNDEFATDLHTELRNILKTLNYDLIYDNVDNDVENFLDRFRCKLINQINLDTFKQHNIDKIRATGCLVDITPDINLSDLSLLQLMSIISYQSEIKNNVTIIYIDNFDRLAMINDSHCILGGLRTAFDLNQQFVRSVFVGSNKQNLDKIFKDKTQPFYYFGMMLRAV